MKVIFVGSNPSNKNTDPDIPFLGTKSHTVLMSWIKAMNVTDYELMNVWSRPTPKNRGLNAKEIKLGSTWLKTALGNLIVPYIVVALGKTAEKSCKLASINALTLPHPSPRNLLTNDKKMINLLLNSNRKTIESLRKNA
jgi:uracil-DNA glycosylase family 4